MFNFSFLIKKKWVGFPFIEMPEKFLRMVVFLFPDVIQNLANGIYWERESSRWKKYIPPRRPSPDDLELYESFLVKRGEPRRVLLLGGTPELRRILLRHRSINEVYIADFTEDMLRETEAEFGGKLIFAKETVLNTDWLKIPQNIFFDIILGDRVLEQFFPRSEGLFLEKISNLLRDDGIFVTRIKCLYDNFENKNFETIVNSTLIESEFFQGIPYALVWRILDNNASKRALSTGKAVQFLKECYSNYDNSFVKKAAIALEREYKENPFKWLFSAPPKADLIKLLSKYMDIAGSAHSSDYLDAQFYPIFCLSKKKLS